VIDASLAVRLQLRLVDTGAEGSAEERDLPLRQVIIYGRHSYNQRPDWAHESWAYPSLWDGSQGYASKNWNGAALNGYYSSTAREGCRLADMDVDATITDIEPKPTSSQPNELVWQRG
jgi:hypothetical protein